MIQANERPSDKVFCLPLGRFYYGIALECVAETVQGVQITPFPCLPDYYCGVCSHKGTVTPVISLRRLAGQEGCGSEEGGRAVTVFLRHGDYLCGILTEEKPVLLDLSAARAVEEDCGELSDRLLIREVCATEEGVILLVDVPATLEGLAVGQ
ncbi:chemotaxis protein CheW [Acetanaerobacterium sp. MSJ-12]|uniref:chemotaxis protein CheW n=1 Tax=Acetanaerobacterium sp. MSJ-12 TaxID=2841535 RepID=UPI001C0E936F|nr:chemotaxis protein CheW [Acetanaerobacterium sp. MSJ-12]MBU5420691.1 chemotaxis protein CheW [Acetanaerobacterium sp. MSJ-12]